MKIISLKLLILKDYHENFASNIKRNWAIQLFYLMISGQKQNLAMISYKTFRNMNKTFSSGFADFGH